MKKRSLFPESSELLLLLFGVSLVLIVVVVGLVVLVGGLTEVRFANNFVNGLSRNGEEIEPCLRCSHDTSNVVFAVIVFFRLLLADVDVDVGTTHAHAFA